MVTINSKLPREDSDEVLLQAFLGLLPRGCAVTKATVPWDASDLYRSLPDGFPRLPRLYEELICRYRWHRDEDRSDELDIGDAWYRLWTNAPSKVPFHPLLQSVRRDKGLWEALSAAHLFPFAQVGHYDPLCFDLKRARGERCPIVGIDHEGILCFDRIVIRREFAPDWHTFLSLSIRDTRAARGTPASPST